MTRLIATAFGVGYLRPAPGTWGSLVAIPLVWAIHVLGGPIGIVLATLVFFFAGWWATKVETQGKADHDPSEIVIDEVAGQFLAFWPVSFGAAHVGAHITALWPGWITAFVLFRLFDIWKPGPVGWADRRGDALGVMLDDIIAGIFAAIGVILFAAIAHGVLI